MTVKTDPRRFRLAGVKSLASDGNGGYCGVLTSGKVETVGEKATLGQLGNRKFYSTGNQGSDVPVSVKGVGGTGVLSDVASLSDNGGVEGGEATATLLISVRGRLLGRLGFHCRPQKGVGERARWLLGWRGPTIGFGARWLLRPALLGKSGLLG